LTNRQLGRPISPRNEWKEDKAHCNIADTPPLLGALKLLQAHKPAELVERVYTPLAGLLDAHDLDVLEDNGGARGCMQEVRELVGLERAV